MFHKIMTHIFMGMILVVFYSCIHPSKPSPGSVQNINKPAIENEANPEALKHFMDGQMYMTQGNFPMAVIEFQDALELDPKAGPIHTALAESYWNLGKAEKAEFHLKQALELDSADVQARELLANHYVLQKRYELARVQFERLAIQEPKNASYRVALAELAKVNQDFESVIDSYRKAFELDQTRLDYLETAGKFSLRIGKHETAEAIYQQLILIEPDHPPYLKTYIELVLHLKHYNEGINILRELNTSYGVSPRRLAQIGLLAFKLKSMDEAFDALNQATRLDPDNPDYEAILIDMFMETAEYDSVNIYSDKYIIQFPDDPRGYINRALSAMNLNDNETAVNILRPVSETFSGVFSVQYVLGLGYNRKRDYTNAETFFQNAALIQPHSRQVKHSLAILFDTIKNWEKSDSIYVELIKSDSTDAQAYNNFAYSLVERETQLDRALEMVEKAVDLEPKNSAYLDTMGWIYFKLNEYKKALKFISDSIELDEKNPVVLEHLGDVLLLMDNPDKAKEAYIKAWDLDKDNSRLKGKINPQ